MGVGFGSMAGPSSLGTTACLSLGSVPPKRCLGFLVETGCLRVMKGHGVLNSQFGAQGRTASVYSVLGCLPGGHSG